MLTTIIGTALGFLLAIFLLAYGAQILRLIGWLVLLAALAGLLLWGILSLSSADIRVSNSTPLDVVVSILLLAMVAGVWALLYWGAKGWDDPPPNEARQQSRVSPRWFAVALIAIGVLFAAPFIAAPFISLHEGVDAPISMRR
jgi:hypothetical protein